MRHIPNLTPSQTAYVSDMPVETLRAWQKRDLLRMRPALRRDDAPFARLHRDNDSRESPGAGRSSSFSHHRVLQVAIGAELTKRSIPVTAALSLAIPFTDIGHADVAPGPGQPIRLHRAPGQLFREPHTYLLAYFEMDRWASEVLHVKSKEDRLDLIPKLFPPGRRTCLIIDLDALVFNVLRRLEELGLPTIDAMGGT